MLQIMDDAGPEQVDLNFLQISHMKLSGPRLAFDSLVAKLQDFCAAAVLSLSFFGGHLFPEHNDRWVSSKRVAERLRF